MTERQSQSLLTDTALTEQVPKRSWFKRTFGPLGEGALRGAIFSLLAGAMGTGIFNLPLRCEQTGVIAFMIFVTVAATFSSIGSLMLTRLIMERKFESYGELARTAGGSFLMRLSHVCLILYPWGLAVCFQVILAKFIVQLLNDIAGINMYENRDDEVYNNTGNLYRILLNVGAIVLSLPIVLKKNVAIVQKLGLIAVLGVVFNFIAIIITTFTGFEREIDSQTLYYHGIFNLEQGQIHWMNTDGTKALSLHAQGFASVLFCFVNQQLLFTVGSTLKRPSQKRFNKIVGRVNVTEFIIYLLIGVLAYLLLVEHADKYDIAPMVIVSIPTTLITVGKVAMCFALFFAISLNMFPTRNAVFQAFSLEQNNKNHIIVTFILVISSCGVAIAFQKVNSYFGLLGGTVGVLMAGTIPGISYARLKDKMSCADILCLILIGIATVVAFAGAVLSVVDPA